jgi:hypothetical protein
MARRAAFEPPSYVSRRDPMRVILSLLCALLLALSAPVATKAHLIGVLQDTSALPPEAREFDFWVGTWDLGTNGNQGHDVVKRVGAGVGILEKFTAPGVQGWSITVYDPRSETWTQTWHTTKGSYIQFTGKKEGDQIVLVSIKDDTHLRLSFVDIKKDSFAQVYAVSHDGGKTWQQLNRIPFIRVKK